MIIRRISGVVRNKEDWLEWN